jgi:hypothetical protein
MNVVVLTVVNRHSELITGGWSMSVDDAITLLQREGTPAFQIADGTTTVEVSVTPDSDRYFGGTVTLAIGPDGAPEITDDDGLLWASIRTEGTADARISSLIVAVSRLRLATRDMTAALHRIVTQSHGTRQPTPQWLVPWLPPEADTMALAPREKMHFIDAKTPIADGLVNFTAPKPASVAGDTFVVEVAGVRAPRAIAVSWPTAVPRDEPAPMLLYYRPGCGQNVQHGYYVAPGLEPYPWAYDYAFFGMLQQLWYLQDPLIGYSDVGVPYQIAESGKKVVTVLPCNSVGPEFGSFTDPASVLDNLGEIQAFAAAAEGLLPASKIGRVALGAFSSGNGFVSRVFASGRGQRHPLLTDHVREVYMFDPPNDVAEGLLNGVLTWARPLGEDAKVRWYSRGLSPHHARVIGKPTPGAGPYVVDSANGSRSAGAIDPLQWQRSIAKATGVPSARALEWNDAHALIAAFLLTHAMDRSGF